MRKKQPYVHPYRYPSPNIPFAAINSFARQYAYGKPHNEATSTCW